MGLPTGCFCPVSSSMHELVLCTWLKTKARLPEMSMCLQFEHFTRCLMTHLSVDSVKICFMICAIDVHDVYHEIDFVCFVC